MAIERQPAGEHRALAARRGDDGVEQRMLGRGLPERPGIVRAAAARRQPVATALERVGRQRHPRAALRVRTARPSRRSIPATCASASEAMNRSSPPSSRRSEPIAATACGSIPAASIVSSAAVRQHRVRADLDQRARRRPAAIARSAGSNRTVWRRLRYQYSASIAGGVDALAGDRRVQRHLAGRGVTGAKLLAAAARAAASICAECAA